MSKKNTKKETNPKSKRNKILITIAVIVIAVVIIGLAVFNAVMDSGVTLRLQTAAQTEHYKINGSMMAYLYNVTYQNYASYITMFGGDTSKSLKTQSCPLATNASWFDYIASGAKSEANELLAMCEAAYAAGVSLDENDLKSVDEYAENLNAVAKQYNYANADKYLKAVTGNPVTLEDVKECLKLSTLVSKYADQYLNGIGNEESELEEYYEANRDKFDGVDFYSWTFTAEIPEKTEDEEVSGAEEDADAPEANEGDVTLEDVDISEAGEGDVTLEDVDISEAGENVSEDKGGEDESGEEAGEEDAELAAAMEALKEQIESRLAGISSVEEFVNMIQAQIAIDIPAIEGETEETVAEKRQEKMDKSTGTHVLKSGLDEETAEWAFSASVGDTHITKGSDGKTYTVYMLSKEAYRDEGETRNVRHILFRSDNYEDDSKAVEVLEQLKEAGFTDEIFEQLAAEYSDDTGSSTKGGLYENVSKGQMVAEFEDWLFDESRQPGDSGIIKAESTGWHIMYYVGPGELNAWQTDARSNLRDEAYTALIEKYSENVKFFDTVIAQIAG